MPRTARARVLQISATDTSYCCVIISRNSSTARRNRPRIAPDRRQARRATVGQLHSGAFATSTISFSHNAYRCSQPLRTCLCARRCFQQRRPLPGPRIAPNRAWPLSPARQADLRQQPLQIQILCELLPSFASENGPSEKVSSTPSKPCLDPRPVRANEPANVGAAAPTHAVRA